MVTFNLTEKILDYIFGSETRKMALAKREVLFEDYHFDPIKLKKYTRLANINEDVYLYFSRWLPNFVTALTLTYAFTRQDFFIPLGLIVGSEYWRNVSNDFSVHLSDRDFKKYIENKIIKGLNKIDKQK